MMYSRTVPRAGLLLRALAFTLCLPAAAAAQLVTPKTVPVHQGEQFDVFPSSRPGTAGIGIALNDTLLDPFVNPAKAVRVRGGTVFGVPFSHDVSGDRGGGRTLPIGGMATVGPWSMAGVVALQQLDRAGRIWNLPTTERTATNRYLSASLARRLGDGLALGVSAFSADLGAIDGVDLLYAGSDRIEQHGSVTDLRLGLLREWSDRRSLELLVLHNRTDMVHDVHFPVLRRWDPRTGVPLQEEPERSEHNVDRTHIWGVHAGYTLPVEEGWRIGWIGTANRLSHPKIPNYVIMNIPRDPGTTYAFNAGMGAAYAAGPVSFAMDFVYEPMWSETWADAAADTATAKGGVIREGERTVENRFRFANGKLRMGMGREFALGSDSASSLGVQFGLSVYSIDYDLEQTNHVLESFREQHEDWMEWTPSLALRLRGRNLEFAYAVRLTCGASGCDVPFPFGMEETRTAGPLNAGGIIAAPSGPLFIDGGSVWAQRVTVTVPIR
jgi:hypothetical protein